MSDQCLLGPSQPSVVSKTLAALAMKIRRGWHMLRVYKRTLGRDLRKERQTEQLYCIFRVMPCQGESIRHALRSVGENQDGTLQVAVLSFHPSVWQEGVLTQLEISKRFFLVIQHHSPKGMGFLLGCCNNPFAF
ncbi:hypothetical protein CDAR_510931 [Caerostris darwini]|uniref:Uncharacterized protein n=1 Tax=Caerostris darwini TaxID=1538125 RepID=A0AAV4T6N8_9ARAC|nr:hypothetical protein CDAR_510931 [Caerostris darwini]